MTVGAAGLYLGDGEMSLGVWTDPTLMSPSPDQGFRGRISISGPRSIIIKKKNHQLVLKRGFPRV